MKALINHSGKCVPLYLPNIDTDQIVPKKFLLKVERTGYDEALFHDWKYAADGDPNPEFVLNEPRYEGASVLIAGPNFGCGSSREHAPWALHEFGFRVIIAESFADIFFNNCFKTGLLPIKLPGNLVRKFVSEAGEPAGLTLDISLEEMTIDDGSGDTIRFEVDEFRRSSLINGLDDIEQTLLRSDAISEYEEDRQTFLRL